MRLLVALALLLGHCEPGPEMEPAVREAPVGLWGLPFAPGGLDDCQTAQFYRIQWGLPERFDRLAFRESRCTNTPISRTGCCVGHYQLHKIIFRDHRMIDRLALCEATWVNVRGPDGLSMQRQACAAKALFDVAGFQPWRTG